MPSLSRQEALTRAALLDVRRYVVDLDLTTGGDTFGSRTVVSFRALAAGETFVEIKPHELRSVTLDGQSLDTGALAGNRLPLRGLQAGEHELVVEALLPYSRAGSGLHRSTDPADGETYVYSHLFLDNAPRVFAAFDQPDLKAVVELSVRVPGHWTVLANTEAQHLGQGRWRAAPTPPIPTHLVAVAAGPWYSITTGHRGVSFGLHCRQALTPHLMAEAGEIFEITRQCFDRYHETFTEPYPFDTYDQAFVPGFTVGGMENPGLVTLREEFVFRSAVTRAERRTRALLIAHEMAHMWFGGLVTLRWWDDIWLNESFAEFMGYRTVAGTTLFTEVWTAFGIGKSAGYDADQRPSTHPVAPAPHDVHDTDAALLNFDGISYAKGAAVLRQLVAWLGEEDFLAGVNIHLTRHRFGNATLTDFVDSLAGATSRDVHSWAGVWLRTTGPDVLTPVVTGGNDACTVRVEQSGSRPHRIAVGLYDADGTALALRERLEVDIPQSDPLRVGRRPALILLNDGDLSYAKVRLDVDSLAALGAGLSGLPSALSRAVVWTALRDAVRDNRLAPAAYLDLARAHLHRENDLTIIHSVLDFAVGQIADRYVTPDRRPAALVTVADLCDSLVSRTDGGGDPGLRLIAVRTLVRVTARPSVLAGWLARNGVPGGPELDAELRWSVLERLAVLGVVGEQAIAAELGRDRTAAGREAAARCRAARPDPDAKERAWADMFGPDDLSSPLVVATAQGFWQPEQDDLVRPYVARYFPAAVATTARRGPAIAYATGSCAFPAYAVDADTRRRAEVSLRGDDLIPALRRRFSDQLDDLTRALRIRNAGA